METLVVGEHVEPARFETCDVSSSCREPEVAPALFAFVRGPARLLDQAVTEHRTQRTVEICGKDGVVPALLKFSNQAPPMSLAAIEGQQHLEHQRFQRKEIAGIARHRPTILSKRH